MRPDPLRLMSTRIFLITTAIVFCFNLCVEAQPPTSIKTAAIRTEKAVDEKPGLALPYLFTSDSLGTTIGLGGGVKGYGQKQLVVGGTAFASDDEAKGVILGLWDYRLPFTQSFFFSMSGSLGHYPRQRAYSDIYFSPDNVRPGSNDSHGDAYIETPGHDNWLDFQLDYVLPIGTSGNDGIASYRLTGGMPASPSGGGRVWNPLTSGVTQVAVRQYNRYQSFESSAAVYERSIHPIEIGIYYNNTDFPTNPSFGSSQYLSYTDDYEWLGANNRWNFIQFEGSKYFSFGANEAAKQRVVAFNFWTGHCLSWREYVNADGNIVVKNRPPTYEGASLGGFYRMRGYPNHRFNDRSVIYTAAEYRHTPYWNPLGQISWLKFFEIDWLQFVFFTEAGRVSRDYDQTLLKNWKMDFGGGLRAMLSGSIVRLDIGFSNQELNTYIMLGHPF